MVKKIVIEKLTKDKEQLKIKGVNIIKFCSFCFSYNVSNKWKEKELEDLMNELKTFFYIVDKNLITKKINTIEIIKEPTIKGGYKDYLELLIENKFLVKIPYIVEMCPNCKKAQGLYHEIVLQFREVDEKIIREFLEEIGEKQIFVKEISGKNEEVDIKLTHKKIVREIAKKFSKKYGLEFKYTRKLITFDHERSKNVYRDFILLRQLSDTSFFYYKGYFWKREGNYLINLENKEKIKIPSFKDLKEVEVEELEKISESKDLNCFMDKEYNTYFFKANKVIKLKYGQKEKFIFI